MIATIFGLARAIYPEYLEPHGRVAPEVLALAAV
jgi:hypothetical protein